MVLRAFSLMVVSFFSPLSKFMWLAYYVGMRDIVFCRGAGSPLTVSSGVAGRGNNHAHFSGDVDVRGKHLL